jgi:3-methyladenine DNA glycosylase AlkD
MMNKIDRKFSEVRQFCEENANPDNVKKYSRYFTEGYDAYGLDKNMYLTQRDKWLTEWEEEFSFIDFLELGNKLIATGKYEEASFAVSFMYSNTNKFTKETFEKLGLWLENGIVNWAHTDVLSGNALSYFFTAKILEIEAFSSWTNSESIWKKRAVPVTLVQILKEDVSFERIFAVITPLMMDEAKKVQQGLGWLLREAWKKEPSITEEFLLKWKDSCGRTIIQYATEKMTKEYRLKFRREKKI